VLSMKLSPLRSTTSRSGPASAACRARASAPAEARSSSPHRTTVTASWPGSVSMVSSPAPSGPRERDLAASPVTAAPVRRARPAGSGPGDHARCTGRRGSRHPGSARTHHRDGRGPRRPRSGRARERPSQARAGVAPAGGPAASLTLIDPRPEKSWRKVNAWTHPRYEGVDPSGALPTPTSLSG
jgi:hypothetical protein